MGIGLIQLQGKSFPIPPFFTSAEAVHYFRLRPIFKPNPRVDTIDIEDFHDKETEFFPHDHDTPHLEDV